MTALACSVVITNCHTCCITQASACLTFMRAAAAFQGDDLHATVSITLQEALCGCDTTIAGIDGTQLPVGRESISFHLLASHITVGFHMSLLSNIIYPSITLPWSRLCPVIASTVSNASCSLLFFILYPVYDKSSCQDPPRTLEIIPDVTFSRRVCCRSASAM